MSDLVKKLREGDRWDYSSGDLLSSARIMDDAADRIENLERVLAQAREAITQLVACHDEPSCPAIEIGEHYIAAIDEALK